MNKKMRERYSKFTEAIIPFLEEIRKEIENSPNEIFEIKAKDLAKKLGSDFENMHETSLYWGARYAFFINGFVIATKRAETRELIFTIRKKNKEDELPLSLKED